MIEKFQKREKRNKWLKKPLSTKTRNQERKKEYIQNKIKKFWRLRSKPNVLFIIDNRLKLVPQLCDFKICGYYVYRIPSNKANMIRRLLKVTDCNINDLIFNINDLIARNHITLTSKYVYLLL